MQFLLFSKIPFEITRPIDLIESYCFQSDFYVSYDLLNSRSIEDVSKIGARIDKNLLRKCKIVIGQTKHLTMFKYDLDQFLNLTEKTRIKHIKELDAKVVQKLLRFKGIGLSRATKVLHTLYPKIIPMIDKQLQKEYRRKINQGWTQEQAFQILIDYYNNFIKGDNWQNLNKLSKNLKQNNIKCLTKIRVFDILWWSYLKAKKLSEKEDINWSVIKWKSY